MNELVQKLKGFMTKENRIRIIVMAGIAGIALLLMSDLSWINESSDDKTYLLQTELEQRLKSTLESITGVGNANVMVTLDDDGAVCGVVVVCDGGDSSTSKEKISDAVTTVFGISASKVYITKLDD